MPERELRGPAGESSLKATLPVAREYMTQLRVISPDTSVSPGRRRPAS